MANLQIRQAMRENERYILNRFRKNPTATTFMFSIPLYNDSRTSGKGGDDSLSSHDPHSLWSPHRSQVRTSGIVGEES